MSRHTLLLAGVLLFSPSQASAVPILITSGEQFSYLGEVPAELKAAIRADTKADPAVGYKYSHFGIFWLALWTWDGDYCLYQGNKYWKLTPAQAAILLKKPEAELSKPFWYRFPPGLLVVGGLVAFSVAAGVLSQRPQKKLKKLFADARYQKALEVFSAQMEKETAAAQQKAAATADQGGQSSEEVPDDPGRQERAFEAAVQHLMSEGIPKDEAEKNLTLMLNAVSQAQAQEAGES
jgi:hypothetical protein